MKLKASYWRSKNTFKTTLKQNVSVIFHAAHNSEKKTQQLNVTNYQFCLLFCTIWVITAWGRALCLMWNESLCSETCWLYGDWEGVMPLWASSGTNEVKGNFWGVIISFRKWSPTTPYHTGDDCLDSGAWGVKKCVKNKSKCHHQCYYISVVWEERTHLCHFNQLCPGLTLVHMNCFIFNTIFYMTLCFITTVSISFLKMPLEWFIQLQRHCLCVSGIVDTQLSIVFIIIESNKIWCDCFKLLFWSNNSFNSSCEKKEKSSLFLVNNVPAIQKNALERDSFHKAFPLMVWCLLSLRSVVPINWKHADRADLIWILWKSPSITHSHVSHLCNIPHPYKVQRRFLSSALY